MRPELEAATEFILTLCWLVRWLLVLAKGAAGTADVCTRTYLRLHGHEFHVDSGYRGITTAVDGGI